MLDQVDFGKRLKSVRKRMNYTQKEVAYKIGVSEQAVSKWENGECLPDVSNLKLLGKLFHVSVDYLLDTDNENSEKVVETIKIGGAIFEVIEKPETIFAGKIIYAKDFDDNDSFDFAIESANKENKEDLFSQLVDSVLPVSDIHLSVNFWKEFNSRAFGFVREVKTEEQPEGIDVYKMPASLFIRAYTDKVAAQLIAKEECEVWELFAYIRNFLMPANDFRMADNGAQELEVFDTAEHKSGYAYMPVTR